MEWTVHGERSLYESDWVNLRLVDVEIPDGPRFEHHVVRFPHEASGTVIHDPDRGVLLLWRHRFITDTWGWEVPAGGLDDGETPEDAAHREAYEETGWRPGPIHRIASYHPINGTADQTFHLFLAEGAEHIGDPIDVSESERVEWVAVDRLRDEIAAGRVRDGLTLTSLLYAIAFGLV